MLLVKNPEHLRKTIAFAKQINKYKPAEEYDGNTSLLANLQSLARYSIHTHKVCPKCGAETWLPTDADNKPEMTDGDPWDRSIKRVILGCDHAVKLEDVRTEPDRRDKTICLLMPESLDEPSFFFRMYKFNMKQRAANPPKWMDREYLWHHSWFCGGLIYHGKVGVFGSVVGPSFAVTMNPTDGWSIHT